MANLAINRPVLVIVILLTLLMFGAMAYFSLSVNMLPDTKIPVVTIQTVYAGANPKDIETQITKKIEDQVATISKIDYMESYSMESVSIVMVKFLQGKDINIANQEVKDKVDAILSDLPDDADRPTVTKIEMGSRPVSELVLSGNISPQDLYEIADKSLKDRFSQIAGVARVDLSGGQVREIQVDVDKRVAQQNGVSLAQLGQILAAANMDMPGGHFLQDDQEYSVRLGGQFATVESIGNIDVNTPFGPKKLRQLASIRDTGAEVRERSLYFDNKTKKLQDNVVRISVVKSSDGNIVQIADAVKKLLPELQTGLPAGVQLNLVDDNSTFIRSSISDTLSNVYMGIILTGLILLLFLSDWRSTLIVAITMPVSLVITFLALQLQGYSINMMSLMGLSTVVGTLVTNSIVVLENIFRHKGMGKDRKSAALEGTSEIIIAVTASALTNVAVFVPIATMQSMVGQLLREFAMTVTYATLISLAISFTLTPMLAARILPEVEKKNAFGRAFDAMFEKINGWYRGTLSWLLGNRWRGIGVIVGSFALMFLSLTLLTTGKIGFEFMPTMDEGKIRIEIELPQGYNIDETAQVLKAIQDKVTAHPEVVQTVSTLGRISDENTGTNMAYMSVALSDAKDRKITTNQMNDRLIEELAEVPNARIKSIVESSASNGSNSSLDFYLYGQNLDELEKIKDQVMAKCKDIPGLLNFDNSSRSGKPEIQIMPRRDKLVECGATVYDLALVVRTAMEGVVYTEYKEGGEEYDMRVMLSDNTVNSPEKIENIPVVTPTGTYRLAQLADIKFGTGVSKITRRDKFEAIQFTGDNAAGVPTGDVMKAIQKQLDTIQLPSGYKFEWSGMTQIMNEMVKDMMRTFAIAIVLTFLLLAAILESFTQPLVILATLPLALIGVFYSLWITGQAMNMFSMLAIVMLVGIVVNNAILQLDYTNQLRKTGMSNKDALLEACPAKLRPIIMSTLAIIVSTLPMALGIGSSGKEFRQSIGIVTIGGILVSAILTLYVIPAMFYVTTHMKSRITKDEKQTAN